MNKIIRQASVIGLFVLAVTIGVSAQSDQQYRAEIPFGFEARGKHYEAGEYSVGPVSRTAPRGIAIREMQTGNSRLLGLSDGVRDDNWDKPGTLTFVRINGRYRLNQISTATFKMKLKSKKAGVAELAGGDAQKVVAIKLN